MIKRKFQSPYLYVASVIIGTIIFIGGFLVTNQIIYDRNSKILETNIDNFYSLFESSVSIGLLNENVCSINFTEKAEKGFYFHRKLIADLENALRKDDEKVILQKKIYTIAQAQHLQIKTVQKRKCGMSDAIILFFYSNDDENIEESERVGSILDSIAYQNEQVIIYSFDTTINSTIVSGLIKKYGIQHVPAVVINDEVSISPKTADELKDKYLSDLSIVLN